MARPHDAAETPRELSRPRLITIAIFATVSSVLLVVVAALTLLYALPWLRRVGVPGLSGEFTQDEFWAQQNNLGALIVGGFSATIGAIVAVLGTWLVAWFVGDRIQKASHKGARELQAQMIKFQGEQATAQRKHEVEIEDRQRVFEQQQHDALVTSRLLEATATRLDPAAAEILSAASESYSQSIFDVWDHSSGPGSAFTNELVVAVEVAFDDSAEALSQISMVIPGGDVRSLIVEVIASLSASRRTLCLAYRVSYAERHHVKEPSGANVESDQSHHDLLITSGRLIGWLADCFRLRVLDVVRFPAAIVDLTAAEATQATELLEACTKFRHEMWQSRAFREKAESWGISP